MAFLRTLKHLLLKTTFPVAQLEPQIATSAQKKINRWIRLSPPRIRTAIYLFYFIYLIFSLSAIDTCFFIIALDHHRTG